MDIPPHKITQPFQLLASWIVGMIFIVWELIYASLNTEQNWQKITYTIASICIGLIFIRVIFLLQTKYRPEMQDSENYQKIYMAKMKQELSSSRPLEMDNVNGAIIWRPRK